MDSNGSVAIEKNEGMNPTVLSMPTLMRQPSVTETGLSSSRFTRSKDTLAPPDPPIDDSNPSRFSSQAEIVGMTKLLYLVFRRTIVWVGSGITFMTLGIGIFQAALLPKIFTCPPDATCDGSYDPNTSTILQLLQTAMTWWLNIGLIVAICGLLRLSAYQSWFIMMKQGNSIENLDLTLGAIKGSLIDACRLVFRRGNLVISLLLLAQIGIGVVINLFVGLSIVRSPGERVVPFSYSPTSELSYYSKQNGAIAKVEGWAMTNDTTHGNALKGSLIIPDGRSNSSVGARAGGPRISGNISCTGVPNGNLTKITGTSEYHILIDGSEYTAYSYMRLSVFVPPIGLSRTSYLWVSNTNGMIPNATTPDGLMYVALCTHGIFFKDAPEPVPDVYYLEPNTVNVNRCHNPGLLCIAESVSSAIVSWWGGEGGTIWGVACLGGVLVPQGMFFMPLDGLLEQLESQNVGKDPTVFCPLTEELWVGTVTSVLDGIMQSTPAHGHDIQSLKANVQNIDSGWWWLQGVIPLMTLLLYLLGLAYTCCLSQGKSTLKALDLEEIIGAAQTDHVRDLIQSGRLRTSKMRYDNGFTKDEAHGP